MIFLTFRDGDGWALGIKTGAGVLDVAAACRVLGRQGLAATPGAFAAMGSAAVPGLKALAEEAEAWQACQAGEAGQAVAGPVRLFRPEAELEIGPPVPAPGKILCVGLNYRPHAAESGMQVPEVPVLFSKFGNAIAAPGEPVSLGYEATQFDYEAEMAVVIGRRARNVTEAEALDCVLGYCNANDLSTRDLQFRTGQWLLGKTQDKFLPMGPYLVTPDEVGDPQALHIQCWVNGELRQASTTAEMIFPVATLISYFSQYMTLEPGDVIATGTPEGVALGRPDKPWLKPGDEVTVEVEKLGRLTNRMVP